MILLQNHFLKINLQFLYIAMIMHELFVLKGETMEEIAALSRCPICSKLPTSPKRLLCGHSFCLTCLKTHLEDYRGNSSFPCPKCECVIKAHANQEVDPDDATSLPDDETAQEFISAKDGNVECVSHLRADIDSYCKTCLVPLCVLCRQEGHSDCDVTRLDGRLNGAFQDTKEAIMKKMKQIVSELTETHSALMPKGRQLLMKKEQTALGISDYFSDLRQKVTQYLIQQEQKVQEDLENLVLLEKDLLQEDLKLCTVVLEDLEGKFAAFKKICSESDTFSETSALRICTGMNRHLTHVDSVKNKLSKESPETRFIINTELEDAMTSTDLIKIEVINTRQYDQRRDTTLSTSEQTTNERSADDNEDVVSGSSSSVASSETDTESEDEIDDSLGAGNNTGQSNVFIEISDTEEPPPPYPGIPHDQTTNDIVDHLVEQSSQHNNQQIKPSLSDVISGNSPRTFQHLRPVPSAPPPSLIDRSEDGSGSTDSEGHGRSASPQPVRYVISGRPQVTDERSPMPQRRHLHHSHPNQPQSRQSVDRRRSRDRPGTNLRLQLCWKAASTAIGDMKPPRIFGLSWIDHEYLLLADRWNHRLKVVHSSGNVVHVFSLGNFQPWDIADMPNKYCAIALPEAKMIYIMLYIKPELLIKKKIPTKRGYSVLTYNPADQTFIGATLSQFFSPPGIDILNKEGHILTSCYPENTGRTFLSYPRGIAVVDDRIMVTDFQKKSVIFVKMAGRGQICQKYQGTETFPLREPNGLALNTRDHYVIVIDSHSSRLHVVSPSGRFLGMVDTPLDNDEPCKAAIFIPPDSIPLLAIAYSNGNVSTYKILDR